MNRTIILLLLLAQSSAGCASMTRSRPVVHRRYDTYTRVQDTARSVSLTVFAVPVPASSPPETGITSFAGDAQAEMVRAMVSRTPNGGPHALVQALAMPIRGSTSAPSFRDLTRVSRRLVFSLDNESGGPANRISEARIYVRPMGGARFASWNRIENDYQTVELGKLSMSQERSTSAELGMALPVLSAAPKVSGSAGSTLQEEILLRQQRTALTGALRPHQAMLLQQGGTGIDLTGNVTADFDVVVPQGGHEPVFLASLPDSCKQRPAFNRQTIRYPARSTVAGRDTAPEPVWVSVELKYLLRDVLRGHETTMEGDDSVAFRQGTDTISSVDVIPSETLRFSVYELRLRDTTVVIKGASLGATEERIAPLQFATFDEAAAMLAWVRRCSLADLGYPLEVRGREVQETDRRAMHVWRVPVNYKGPGGETRVRR